MERVPFFACLALAAAGASAQDLSQPDSTGLPGDNFNMPAALEMFKKSIDLEAFETALNSEGNHVHNLDLDANGQVDYIRVTSFREGNAAAIVLTVPVSATENQDVAVIEIEKTGEEKATLQMRGDKDLFGEDHIVEPFAEQEGVQDGNGPSMPELIGVQVVVNVWAWDPVPWCFSGRYYPYVSTWYWGHYPGWWRPWRPHPWRVWWGWGSYHAHWYRPWHQCRVVQAHALYSPRRLQSATVRNRYREAHIQHQARPARNGQVKPATRPSVPSRARPSKPAPTKPAQRPPQRTTPRTPRPNKGK